MGCEPASLSSPSGLEGDDLKLPSVEHQPVEAPRGAHLERRAATDVRVLVAPARVASGADADPRHEATEPRAHSELAGQPAGQPGGRIRRSQDLGDPWPHRRFAASSVTTSFETVIAAVFAAIEWIEAIIGAGGTIAAVEPIEAVSAAVFAALEPFDALSALIALVIAGFSIGTQGGR